MLKILFVALCFAVAKAQWIPFFQLIVKDLDNNDVSLGAYKGKCVLVVATDSGSGNAGANIEWLKRVSAKFPSLEIVAFPFKGQEKLGNTEIKKWFEDKNVPLKAFAPIQVNEPGQSPLFRLLVSQDGGTAVDGSFTKFLVQKDGFKVTHFPSKEGLSNVYRIEAFVDKCLNH